MWSSHVFIALDEAGALGIDALLDEEVQRLAWENHGFRTGVYDAPTDTAQFGVEGVAEEVTLVAPKSIVRSEGKAVRVIDKRKI